MAISTVRVKINGAWTNLTYNGKSGEYEGTIAAPSITSYNLSGGYYPVTVEAANDAGTITTKDDTDIILGSSLRLVVREKIKPVITLESPTNGAYIQNNNAQIIFTVTDEAGGSGVKADSIFLTLDSKKVSLTKAEYTNGYRCVYTPDNPLDDGKHSISIQAEDNDGNTADAVESIFTVDTIPPTLEIQAPTFTITNQPECTVTGVTNDATSSPVSVRILLNGKNTGNVAVDNSGGFTKALTLSEGTNEIEVISIDGAGRSTIVTLQVKLDTTIPEITSVTFAPNPVDTSQSVKIRIGVR